MGRGGSSQSSSSQSLIRGDPSQVLACVVGHSRTPCPLTPSLSLCFLNRSEVANEPWVPMVGVGGWGESWPCLQATCLMGEVRAGPGDQSPLGSWLEHGSVAWIDGEEDRAVQAAVVPRRVDASGISAKSRLVWWARAPGGWNVELSEVQGVGRGLSGGASLPCPVFPRSHHHMSLLPPSRIMLP